MWWYNLHIKVRWAAVAAALATVLIAVAGAVGASAPAWVAAALTAVAGVLAGYSAPAHGDPQDLDAIGVAS